MKRLSVYSVTFLELVSNQILKCLISAAEQEEICSFFIQRVLKFLVLIPVKRVSRYVKR